ncbi:unnamed protein product, partial [Allacma fusca]
CSTTDCLETLENVFNQVTNIGKASPWFLMNEKTWAVYTSNEEYRTIDWNPLRISSDLWTNPRESGPKNSHPSLYEITYSYLVQDLDLNVSRFVREPWVGKSSPANSNNGEISVKIGHQFGMLVPSLVYEFRLTHTPVMNFITS